MIFLNLFTILLFVVATWLVAKKLLPTVNWPLSFVVVLSAHFLGFLLWRMGGPVRFNSMSIFIVTVLLVVLISAACLLRACFEKNRSLLN